MKAVIIPLGQEDSFMLRLKLKTLAEKTSYGKDLLLVNKDVPCGGVISGFGEKCLLIFAPVSWVSDHQRDLVRRLGKDFGDVMFFSGTAPGPVEL